MSLTVFWKALRGESEGLTRLGNPSPDEGFRLRREQTMFAMRGGNGFRTPPQEPRVRANGLTRGEMKRKRRQIAIDNENERQEREARKLMRAGVPLREAFSRFGSLANGG